MAKTALASRGSKYNDTDRRKAIGVYVVTGNYTETAKQLNMPERTINQWGKTEWWLNELAVVREEKQDELDAQITGSIHKAFKKVDDRLELGDPYITKTGEIGYKPVSCRDSATVGGIMYDKRALLRNMPTNITVSTDSHKLLKLQEKFEQLVGNKAKIIEGQIVD